MPEPDYAGDSPGFWGCLIGSLILFLVFVVWKVFF